MLLYFDMIQIMRQILILLVLVLGILATAQSIVFPRNSLTVKVGMNLSKTIATGEDETQAEWMKVRLGFIGGLEYEHRFNKWLGVSAGVLYSQQGYRFKDIILGGLAIENIETHSADYLAVPIAAKFHLWKGLSLGTGIQPEFKVKAKDKGVRGVQLVLPLLCSYEYCNFVFEARYVVGASRKCKITESAPIFVPGGPSGEIVPKTFYFNRSNL